jgi:glycosyltransferase involved in cell wall biosynthesis
MAEPAPVNPRISVVIPTYNRSEMLRSTLVCLAEQSLPTDEYEVIVSDDGSSDDTKAVVESIAGRLRIKYHFQEDLGFRAAAARNAGARLAEAPVLVFLDSGTLAGPDFLAAHLRSARPGQAVLGYVHGYPPAFNDLPDFKPVEGLAEAIAKLTPEQVVARYRDEPAFRDARYGEFEKSDFDLSRRTIPEELFWTSNCSVAAADFWAVEGFDENFRSWGLEDVDLGYRLVRAGTKLQLSLDAWAVETPHERDDAANFASLMGNAQLFLNKYQYNEPLLELVWLMLLSGDGVLATMEILNRQLVDWARECAETRVQEELAEAFARIPAGKRVAVFGAGAQVPADAPAGAILADFDPDAVARLRETHSGHDVRYNIGIRTALPDGAVDTVVITPRLAGLWPQFGKAVLNEANRIGAEVVQLFPEPEPASAAV